MKEYRCACGQLLFKGNFSGNVEIKCRRCKKLKYIEVEKIIIKEIIQNGKKTQNKNSVK